MPDITLRSATLADSQRIAFLCELLGYPVSTAETAKRLNQILNDYSNAVFVAEASGGEVIGWVQVYLRQLVVLDMQAEIGGLIVDPQYRRLGAGRLLMQQAESWAREKGCHLVHLRSNVTRPESHPFYTSVGYQKIKTQHTYRKLLSR